jgi:hypothetical protein
VQKEIVKADRSANVRVYFVWLPMLPSDDESEARGMARRLASSGARHFYDPQRRAGIAFVQDHFQDYIREALAVLPKDHPFRERLAQRAEVPASESPLWDAVMFFAPGADWNSKSPRPDWWAKQIGFHGEGARGNPQSNQGRPDRVGLVCRNAGRDEVNEQARLALSDYFP